jgi:co-chaperonin GroES (HSP10)
VPPMIMVHDVDPAQDVTKKIGDLSKFEVFHNQILVGVYIRPEKTKSGLILADRTRDEDRWQGKTGVVLKKGKQAFVDDETTKFTDNVEIGDWVYFRVSDGFPITVNGVLCRLLEEAHIKGRVATPDVVF